MKFGAVLVGCFVLCTSALAQTAPSQAQIDEYLEVSRTKAVISAQADSYLQQMSIGVSPEAKAQYAKYVNALMGWDGLKDQYVGLIGKTYTAGELRAAIAFYKSPAGRSMSKKSVQFSEQLSAMSARNAQALSARSDQATGRDQGGDESDTTAKDLAVHDVEKHVQSGQTYYTDSVDNNGKKQARGVQVELNLFSGGRFVDQYTTYISGTIPPGTSRYFKVSCGCKDSSPAPHDSFKVNVVSSY